MPKFLVEAIYTAEGHKRLVKDKASGWKTAITQAVKKLGGNLDAIYFCLGENDLILIVDMPDHASAAAAGLIVPPKSTVRPLETWPSAARDLCGSSMKADGRSGTAHRGLLSACGSSFAGWNRRRNRPG